MFWLGNDSEYCLSNREMELIILRESRLVLYAFDKRTRHCTIEELVLYKSFLSINKEEWRVFQFKTMSIAVSSNVQHHTFLRS